MKKRGALEISFGWLFAIIAGAFILFLAIYFVTKMFQTENEVTNAKTGKEIGTLLNPLEISFEAAKTVSITIPADTRIYNLCDNKGVFGKQFIQLSQKSFNKWTETDIKTTFYNKYIFSEDQTEGKTFYFFSKPFDFPFKVADLLYMTSEKQRYCFVDPPSEVEEEISSLSQDNLLTQNCIDTNIRVCFDDDDCDINVDYRAGIVEKNGESMSFVTSGEFDDENSLMYAAIFSSPDIYECQVNRLLMRLKELSLLYKDKESIAEGKGCSSSEVGTTLIELSNMAGQLSNSGGLESIKDIVNDVNNQNKIAECMLW